MPYSDCIDGRLFDFSQFYDRMANELPNGCKIVECGVANGKSAIYLAEKLNELGKEFTLYMIDSLAYGQKDQLYEIIKNVVNSGFVNNIEIIPEDSLNASCKFNGNSLDMVFLDSSHEYSQTKAEILLWYEKVKVGAVLAGHDFFSKENTGVWEAVKDLIPEKITREPIISYDEQGKVWLDEFKEEELLITEETTDGNGVWSLVKRFYWKP